MTLQGGTFLQRWLSELISMLLAQKRATLGLNRLSAHFHPLVACHPWWWRLNQDVPAPDHVRAPDLIDPTQPNPTSACLSCRKNLISAPIITHRDTRQNVCGAPQFPLCYGCNKTQSILTGCTAANASKHGSGKLNKIFQYFYDFRCAAAVALHTCD